MCKSDERCIKFGDRWALLQWRIVRGGNNVWLGYLGMSALSSMASLHGHRLKRFMLPRFALLVGSNSSRL